MRRYGITLILAVLAGALLAVIIVRAGRGHSAKDAIASDDAARRDHGWLWLLADGRDGAPRALSSLDEIAEKLDRAGDAALLDASDRLRGIHAWSFADMPADLVMRDVALRVDRGGDDDIDAIIDALEDCPLDADDAVVIRAAELALDRAPLRHDEVMDALLGWGGPGRLDVLMLLEEAIADPALRRTLILASVPGEIELGDPAPLPMAEADLLITAHAGDVDLVTEAFERGDYPDAAWAEVLRHTSGRAGNEHLMTLAGEGNRAAEFALLEQSPDAELERARPVARAADEPAWRRRLAAWRWPGIPRPILDAVLDADPATDESDRVTAAVLVAERHLTPADAAVLAEAWIRSFDDDRKRAGAILAALVGEHDDLLIEALEAEDVGDVRTTQRLALFALDRVVGAEDPREFTARAMRDRDGAIDVDHVLCRLAGGDLDAMQYVVELPAAPSRGDVQLRSWLIERFVPAWHEDFGRAIGGDDRGVRLYFDALAARLAIERRRLVFDDTSRTFALPPSDG